MNKFHASMVICMSKHNLFFTSKDLIKTFVLYRDEDQLFLSPTELKMKWNRIKLLIDLSISNRLR